MHTIGLAPAPAPGTGKHVKLARVGFPTRVLDLHRSNPIGAPGPLPPDPVPEAWYVPPPPFMSSAATRLTARTGSRAT